MSGGDKDTSAELFKALRDLEDANEEYADAKEHLKRARAALKEAIQNSPAKGLIRMNAPMRNS